MVTAAWRDGDNTGCAVQDPWRTFLRVRAKIVYKFRRTPFARPWECPGVLHKNIVKWGKGQRISWLGHLERMEEDRMPKKIFP
jgi:hypothetical protein